jgi:hypothetical protein
MGPQRAQVVEMLKAEDKFEFTMRAPASIRDAIASRGFLNQHDARKSRGTMNPGLRARVEALLVGLSSAEYQQVPNSVRPKYGYLRPAKGSGVSMVDRATPYGEDVFVFRHDAVKDEVTLYPTDSLSRSELGEGTEWHQSLVPWADRMLLAPNLEINRDELQYSVQVPGGFRNTRIWTRYLEIQIWRPLGLEDVERFEFKTTPPSGAFLQALQKNGVKIFEQGSTDAWKEGEPSP